MKKGNGKLQQSPTEKSTVCRIMKKRLLVVDDEIAILIAFRKIFEGFQIEVDTAETLDQAISMINEREYDAVIADLRLTGILGQEGLEILRRTKEKNPEICLIMITGYGNPDIKKRAYANGADLYCEKPVSIKYLQNALKRFGII
jgi:DNA-binding NtrC family response regulator